MFSAHFFLFLILIFDLYKPVTPAKNQQSLQYVLGNFSSCPEVKSSVITYKFNKTSIEKNIFYWSGSVLISKNLSPNLSFVWRYKKCPNGYQSCSNQMDYPIPGVCSIISGKTIFGDGAGKYFTPKLKCPIKAGQYSYNVSLSLKGITYIPSIGNKYHIKLLVLDGPNQDTISCIDIVSWIKNGK